MHTLVNDAALKKLLAGARAPGAPKITKTILSYADAGCSSPQRPSAEQLSEFDEGLQAALALAFCIETGARFVGVDPHDPELQGVEEVELWLRMFHAVRSQGVAYHWPLLRDCLEAGRETLDQAMDYLHRRAEEEDARAAQASDAGGRRP